MPDIRESDPVPANETPASPVARNRLRCIMERILCGQSL